jgi:hypothetical protein
MGFSRAAKGCLGFRAACPLNPTGNRIPGVALRGWEIYFSSIVSLVECGMSQLELETLAPMPPGVAGG